MTRVDWLYFSNFPVPLVLFLWNPPFHAAPCLLFLMHTLYLHIYLVRFQYEDLSRGEETALVTICEYNILLLIVSNPVHKQFSPKGNGFLEPADWMLHIKKEEGASQIQTNNAVSFSYRNVWEALFLLIQINTSADIFQACSCKTVHVSYHNSLDLCHASLYVNPDRLLLNILTEIIT